MGHGDRSNARRLRADWLGSPVGQAGTIDRAAAAAKAMRELVIDGTRINDDGDCYVIAEIGHNHQGSVEKARELIRTAKECGVSAVKLQKRDNRSEERRVGKECRL